MEIVKQSKNVDKKLAYKLSHNTNKMSELAGSPVKVEAFVFYKDTDMKTGELKDVVSILVEGRPYATISDTFIREFNEIADTFGEDDDLEIVVTEGTSKSGRTFITASIA